MCERWGWGGWKRDLKACQYPPYYILKCDVKTLLIQRIKFALQKEKEKRSPLMHKKSGLGRRRDVEGQCRGLFSNPQRDSDCRVVAMETS